MTIWLPTGMPSAMKKPTAAPRASNHGGCSDRINGSTKCLRRNCKPRIQSPMPVSAFFLGPLLIGDMLVTGVIRPLRREPVFVLFLGCFEQHSCMCSDHQITVYHIRICGQRKSDQREGRRGWPRFSQQTVRRNAQRRRGRIGPDRRDLLRTSARPFATDPALKRDPWLHPKVLRGVPLSAAE